MPKTDQLKSADKPLFEKEILRVSDVAILLDYSKDHIYRLTSKNKIPFKKKGGTLFFLREEIMNWVFEGDS